MNQPKRHRESSTLEDGLHGVETKHGQDSTGQHEWDGILRHARETDTSLTSDSQVLILIVATSGIFKLVSRHTPRKTS
jgi:hypothetical protein